MKERPRRRRSARRIGNDRTRMALTAAIGAEIVRFQDGTHAFDDVAAAVLGLTRPDLQCISLLLFRGPASPDRLLGELHVTRQALHTMLERLELAGYTRRLTAARRDRIELTEHARVWVETLWGPLGTEGARLLERESTRDLRVLARFMAALSPVQDAHVARVRALLDAPGPARSNRARGGLSPAALRRVQLFVEANLDRPVPLAELAARAGLSAFHFARAFKTTMGTTPRAFVEGRRIERAQALLRGSTLPLAQVAAETGLGTQSRFTTTFRRATGFTPAAYRRGLSEG